MPRYTSHMTFALPSLRLRLPLIAGATLLLHYAAIGWLGDGLGMEQERAVPVTPPAIVAQLRAPPPVAQVAAVAAPAPAPAPVRARRTRAAPVSDIPAAPPPAAQDAPEAPVEAAATAPDAEAAPAGPPADPPAEPLPPEVRANVPPSSELALELERVDAKGTLWHGVARMAWQAGAGRYTVKFDAGISMVVTTVTLLELASEGSIGESGFAPNKATEKRRGRALTATHFNREQGSITFSSSQNTAPLAPDAQDKATLPLQLAAIARADPAQFEDGLEITVGEDRAASVYRFIVIGREEIETKLGRLHTLHLSRPPKPGSYNSRLDVWLAPAHGWYPVRIRNTEANGAVTTQTVTHIVVTDPGTAHAK